MIQIYQSPVIDLWVDDLGTICYRAVPGTHELQSEQAAEIGSAFLEAAQRSNPDNAAPAEGPRLPQKGRRKKS